MDPFLESENVPFFLTFKMMAPRFFFRFSFPRARRRAFFSESIQLTYPMTFELLFSPLPSSNPLSFPFG